MIELHIEKTYRNFNDKQYYYNNNTTHKFKDLKDAKEWLKKEYGKCKRSPMYVDLKTGETKKTGYIYGFKNKWEKCYEQHWVSFYSVEQIYFGKGRK